MDQVRTDENNQLLYLWDGKLCDSISKLTMIEWTRSSLTKMFFLLSFEIETNQPIWGLSLSRNTSTSMAANDCWTDMTSKQTKTSRLVHYPLDNNGRIFIVAVWSLRRCLCQDRDDTCQQLFNHCAGQHNWDRWPSCLVTQICPNIGKIQLVGLMLSFIIWKTFIELCTWAIMISNQCSLLMDNLMFNTHKNYSYRLHIRHKRWHKLGNLLIHYGW